MNAIRIKHTPAGKRLALVDLRTAPPSLTKVYTVEMLVVRLLRDYDLDKPIIAGDASAFLGSLLVNS